MIYLKRFSVVTIKVKIGTLLGTEWVLSIANWRQPSQRIAEQFFRIGGEVVQMEKAVATLVFFLMSGKRHGNSPRVAGSSLAVRRFFLFLTAYLALVNFVFFSPII